MTTVPLHDPYFDPDQPGSISSLTDRPAQQQAAPLEDGTCDQVLDAAAAVAPSRAPTGLAPAAGGPAGPRLEAHVGAQYLLPLLSGGEARGLPGVRVTQVSFQRGGLGHPMDDVVVTGFDHLGHPATLELQAKRSPDFTASDGDFRKVVAMAGRAAAKPEFKNERYELAVAIARTSTKIERSVQEALRWARASTDAADYFARLDQPGAGGAKLRADFVEVFRAHLVTAGFPSSDEDLWAILRRFQVLVFDCEQEGSQSSLMARERCALLLADGEQRHCGALWTALENEALSLDTTAGMTNAAALKDKLTSELGFKLAGDRGLQLARRGLDSRTKDRLDAIDATLGSARLMRAHLVDAARRALDVGRCLEIQGAGGVGKSAVLRALADEVGRECTALVVAPSSLPGGGWDAFAQLLGCHVSCQEFLRDLAGDGGGILFVDGLDGFDELRERRTVADLLLAAVQVPGVNVVVTARADFDVEARSWLPTKVLEALAEQPPLKVGELNSAEIEELRAADPLLAPLLRPDHPARALSRNLYRLSRLRRALVAGNQLAATEVQMARQWWSTGDLAEEPERSRRRRVLKDIAVQILNGAGTGDTSQHPAETLAGLRRDSTVRELGIDRHEFAHDVLRDWAVACLLADEPDRWQQLDWTSPAPMRLVRAVELAARIGLEEVADPERWKALLERSAQPGCHGSWRRALLLAPLRGEQPLNLLEHCWPVAVAQGGDIYKDMVRAAITGDSDAGAVHLTGGAGRTLDLGPDFVSPRGPSWSSLMRFALSRDDLPDDTIPALLDLFNRWSLSLAGQDALTPKLVAKAHEWIQRVGQRSWKARVEREKAGNPTGITSAPQPLDLGHQDEQILRRYFWTWSRTQPALAAQELRALGDRADVHARLSEMRSYIGTAAQAAPRELRQLYESAMGCQLDKDEEERQHATGEAYGHWDNQYFPPSPQNRPFLDLLRADAEEGLALVRAIVDAAVRRMRPPEPEPEDGIELNFDGQRWTFVCEASYRMARGYAGAVAASALMALEAWSHERVEAGESVDAVVADILGGDQPAAAYLLVAVDVILSHLDKSLRAIVPFLASPKMLAVDFDRGRRDVAGHMRLEAQGLLQEPPGTPRAKDLDQRGSRKLSLPEVVQYAACAGEPADRTWMLDQLDGAVAEDARAGRVPQVANWRDVVYAAQAAAHFVDPGNYVRCSTLDGQEAITYCAPESQQKLIAKREAEQAWDRTEIGLRLRLSDALTKDKGSDDLLQTAASLVSGTLVMEEGEPKSWDVSNRTMAAALVLRDGSPELLDPLRPLALNQLDRAREAESPRGRSKASLTMSESSVAMIGFVADTVRNPAGGSRERLLALACRPQSHLADVLKMLKQQGYAVPQPLLQALVRTGLTAAVRPKPLYRSSDFSGDWEAAEARRKQQEAERLSKHEARLADHRKAEATWLDAWATEPHLPALPEPQPKKGRGNRIRIGGATSEPDLLGGAQGADDEVASGETDLWFNHDQAAAWIDLAAASFAQSHTADLTTLLGHFKPWSLLANGSDCSEQEEPGERLYRWNLAYYRALATATAHGAPVQDLVDSLNGVEEQRFFTIAASVLLTLDALWLEGPAPGSPVRLVRETVIERLKSTAGWRWETRRASLSCNQELASCVDAVFLSARVPLSGVACLVNEGTADKAYELLPLLKPLALEGAASACTARAWMALLEVRPAIENVEHLADAVAAWFKAHGTNAEFWVGIDLSRKLCSWIAAVLDSGSAATDAAARNRLGSIVDTLLTCGFPAARPLEARLNELERPTR